MNNYKTILISIFGFAIACSSPKLKMQNPTNLTTGPKVICRIIAIDDSKLPRIESKIDNCKINIDSSLTQSKISGQIYGRDSTDFENSLTPMIYAKLELIGLIKNDTISALTDFDGKYSLFTHSGEYQIIASYPIKNTSYSVYNKLHLPSIKINKYEAITLNITLGQGQGTTFINSDSLKNAIRIKH